VKRDYRILVVEDHEPMLSAIESILTAEGYEVITAKDGLEALDKMADISPDLILADIMMPRMDGYALYKEVRARSEWVRIPFIFLTAKSEPEDILKGKRLGVEDYITKPFSTDELTIAVQSRLERARAIYQANAIKFNELKQQIINVLGHELRTPLTYVSGYTDLALEDVSNLSRDSFEEFLLGIKQGADRLTHLVEDLLMLTRLDTGQAAQEFKLLVDTYHNLTEIVEQVAQHYAEKASAKGIVLETKMPSSLPAVRLCKPFFEDALDRLIENGIKFSPNEGSKVTVKGKSTNGWIEVAVSDEGVGIAPEQISHLFERFRQIDREQMEQQGTGIGLAIAQGLIDLHGGEITVESNPGAGSTFTIRLPAHPAKGKERET
jgi:signal transduction histidine kinase